MKVILHTDGGARGNPGPAAIGVVLEFPETNQPKIFLAETIGESTNNVAEYRALIRGLEEARTHGAQEVACFLDSELVVRQLTGIYRMRDPRLRAHAAYVTDLARYFHRVTYTSIPRKENRAADALVNRALDEAEGQRR